jgi:hypothetical protein
VIVIVASETLWGDKGSENVSEIVLLTGTPVALSTGSDPEISKAGVLEANLYA